MKPRSPSISLFFSQRKPQKMNLQLTFISGNRVMAMFESSSNFTYGILSSKSATKIWTILDKKKCIVCFLPHQCQAKWSEIFLLARNNGRKHVWQQNTLRISNGFFRNKRTLHRQENRKKGKKCLKRNISMRWKWNGKNFNYKYRNAKGKNETQINIS